MKERLYVQDKENIKKVLDSALSPINPTCQTIKNGIVLPLLIDENYLIKEYKGGVCNCAGDFVTGCMDTETGFSCKRKYDCFGKIKKENKTVIYGGVFFDHFGVMLLQSLLRLWWIVENENNDYDVAFLCEPDSKKSENFCKEIAKLLKIKKYEIIKEPTQFSEVIVPDQAMITHDKISEKFFWPFNKIKNNLMEKYPEKTPEKIYFSRSKFPRISGKPDSINEEYFEDFYRRRGFEIFYPEQLPLEQQIRLVSGAKEYVSTYGTLAHFGPLFLDSGAKQIMLSRAPSIDRWVSMQFSLLKLKKLDWYYIRGTKNPYLTYHDGGVFFYYPTKQFISFLDDSGIKYTEDELKWDVSTEKMKFYLQQWLSVYTNPRAFKALNRPDYFPIIQSLYFSATGKKLDPKDFLE